MHSLDVDADVRCEVPRGADVCGHVTGRDRCHSPVVDVHPVRRRRGEFVPVERGVGLRDDRPCVRVGGRFAGEVPGVEFFEGGVDVVEVERDARRDPLVGVDLDDAEHLGVERLGSWSRSEKRIRQRARRSPRVAMTVDVMFVTPRSAMARMFAISASRPCRMPAFTTRRRSSVQMSSASISAMASQSRAAKYARKRSNTRLAAFSSRGIGGLSSSKRASAASRSASSKFRSG